MIADTTKDLVLITGVTGHVGFAVLKEAFKQGYRVRAAVRSYVKAEQVRNNPALKKLGDIDLSFVVIPDFLAPGAFYKTLEGGEVKYVIHVASPVPQPTEALENANLEEAVVKPAMGMTINLLEAAKNFPSVKRIIVTSSAAAIVPMTAWSIAGPKVYSADSRMNEIPPPYPVSTVAYVASKIAALNRAEAWMQREQPPFDLIHIHPTFVMGRDDSCTTTQGFFLGTNRFALNGALGLVDPQMNKRPGTWVSSADSAYVHVSALQPHVAGNQSFLASSPGTDVDGMQWDSANEIVARRFPNEVASGMFPNTGRCETVGGEMDNRKTEQTFKFKHAKFEDVIVEVLEHYLEVLKREKELGMKTYPDSTMKAKVREPENFLG